MGQLKVEQGRIIVDFPIKLAEDTTVGATGSHFFTELRDSKRIMGIRCPDCKRVYMPPRLSCPNCFREMSEWVQLGNEGTVLTYSTVHYQEEYQPVGSPFTFAIIQLDGADTGFTHFLGEVEASQLKTGMRVQAVFAEKRNGNMLDIRYFKPVK